MAEKSFLFDELNGNCYLYIWAELATGDTGTELEIPSAADKTLTVVGTFAGGSVAVLQGSNDNTNWFTCTDAHGAAVSFTATGMACVMENPRYLRPSVSTGAADSITFQLTARHTQN